MLVPAVALLVGFGVALLLTPVVRAAALDRALLDEPGGRKVHARAVPRLGGAAMLLAFFAAIAVAALVSGSAGGGIETGDLLPILLGVGLVGALGFVDDLRDLGARAKLAGQFAAAVVVVLLGLSFRALDLPWGSVDLGPVGPVLTVIWLVAVVNAVNLIDGLDGLAAGVSLAALLAFAAIAQLLDAPLVALVTLAGAGAVAAFLLFNRPPASIIMGDAGSMFLGMLLGTSAVALVTAEPRGVSLPAAVAVLGVPLADTTWAVVRRLAAGRSIFAADNGHIHHRLMALGLGQGAVTLVLVAASAVLGLLALLLTA